MFDRLSQPLPPNVESQLQANMPGGGPETDYWNQGCEAGYSAALDPMPSNSAVTVTGVFGAAPDVTIPVQWAAPSLYVKTLIQGAGATLTSSEGLIGNVVAYDWSGTTSKLLGTSYSPGLFLNGQVLPSLRTRSSGRRSAAGCSR
jgi:hypothetical protein